MNAAENSSCSLLSEKVPESKIEPTLINPTSGSNSRNYMNFDVDDESSDDDIVF